MGLNDNIEIKETLDKFASILEKFGLDIITKMGQTNLSIKILTDKVNKLSETTIDVKALLPQLSNVIENQKTLETEIDLIRTLIQRSKLSYQSDEMESEAIQRDKSVTDNKQAIIEQFNTLTNYLNDNDDPMPVIESLKKIKEDFYINIGPHKILNEIRQYINSLKSLEFLSRDLKDDLKEKITFWKNKL